MREFAFTICIIVILGMIGLIAECIAARFPAFRRALTGRGCPHADAPGQECEECALFKMGAP